MSEGSNVKNSNGTSKKKKKVVTDKSIIDNENDIEYVVTFDDGSIGRTLESKVYLMAASYPTFLKFLKNCKAMITATLLKHSVWIDCLDAN